MSESTTPNQASKVAASSTTTSPCPAQVPTPQTSMPPPKPSQLRKRKTPNAPKTTQPRSCVWDHITKFAVKESHEVLVEGGQKNMVEAGASLESLAKGAVRFSRRFTIQELQDRWQSLLYDSDTAGEASAHMVEIELSAFALSSQYNKSGDSKEIAVLGKRKEESVRSKYYAMRKRICNEPFNNMDLDFLDAPNLTDYTGTGGCQEQLAIHGERPVRNSMLGDHTRDPFEINDTDFNIVHHGFTPVMQDGINASGMRDATHAFHSGHQNTLESHIPDGIMGGDCLYGFTDNVSPVANNAAVGINVGQSFEHESIHKDISHVLGENMAGFDGNSCVQQMRPPQAVRTGNLFETADMKTNSLSVYHPGDNAGTVCAGFGGNQGFSPPVSDSFHQSGFSSPVPSMPIWRTMEDMPMPGIPTDGNFDGKGAGSTIPHNNDDASKMNSSGFDLPNSLLNFANAEALLFMDIDSKDIVDKSCLDSLNSMLMSSPTDPHQDDPSIYEPKASVGLESCLLMAGSETSNQSSTFAYDPRPEYVNGVICCVLNTEDQDIPDNDQPYYYPPVELPSPFIPSIILETEEPGSSFNPVIKDFTSSQHACELGPDQVRREGFLPSSWPTESPVLPELYSNNPIKANGFNPELHLSDTSALAAGNTGEPSLPRSLPLTSYPVPSGELKEDIVKAELRKHFSFDGSMDFLLEKSLHDSSHMGRPQIYFNGGEQEGIVPDANQNPMQTHLEHIPEMPFSEPAANPSTSNQEEQNSENDEVPFFSDVEAVILEMDLVTSDHDSCFAKEVSRYQYEETKRTIIRLEQSAYACLQRDIASHRAFAILYGRRLKHYIKKPEVLLGRATEDFDVDIDLAKEGRANKISRRQALITMENDGSFCLKNLGKGPISVNSKEVAYGHCIKLGSGCLIEIRSMRFIFESNNMAVRQYLANNAKNNQGQSSKFEWSPEGVH